MKKVEGLQIQEYHDEERVWKYLFYAANAMHRGEREQLKRTYFRIGIFFLEIFPQKWVLEGVGYLELMLL